MIHPAYDKRIDKQPLFTPILTTSQENTLSLVDEQSLSLRINLVIWLVKNIETQMYRKLVKTKI